MAVRQAAAGRTDAQHTRGAGRFLSQRQGRLLGGDKRGEPAETRGTSSPGT